MSCSDIEPQSTYVVNSIGSCLVWVENVLGFSLLLREGMCLFKNILCIINCISVKIL